ncbi:hypothetical protein C8J57DRAFT_1573080 [Mycena rebaudengoi]|nr:hypothetical protein C8J57DRAFT_1573080 [Mycena rebaudengoi]
MSFLNLVYYYLRHVSSALVLRILPRIRMLHLNELQKEKGVLSTSSVPTRIRATGTQTAGGTDEYPIASFLSLPVLFINTTPHPVPENSLLLASLLYPASLHSICRFPNPPSRVASVRYSSFIPHLRLRDADDGAAMAQINMQAVFTCPSEQTRTGAEMNGLLIELFPTTVFAILALLKVQGVVAVSQIGLPVNCRGATDPPCPAPQVCCDLSLIDPSLPKLKIYQSVSPDTGPPGKSPLYHYWIPGLELQPMGSQMMIGASHNPQKKSRSTDSRVQDQQLWASDGSMQPASATLSEDRTGTAAVTGLVTLVLQLKDRNLSILHGELTGHILAFVFCDPQRRAQSYSDHQNSVNLIDEIQLGTSQDSRLRHMNGRAYYRRILQLIREKRTVITYTRAHTAELTIQSQMNREADHYTSKAQRHLGRSKLNSSTCRLCGNAMESMHHVFVDFRDFESWRVTAADELANRTEHKLIEAEIPVGEQQAVLSAAKSLFTDEPTVWPLTISQYYIGQIPSLNDFVAKGPGRL